MDDGNTQNFELDQLNLDTTSENWDEKTPNTTGEGYVGEHDQRAIGNTAIATPENAHEATPQSTPDQTELNPESGQTIPVSLPPEQETESVAKADQPVNSHLAHTVQKALNDEKLTYNDVKDIVDTTRNIDDIADFYETIRPESKEGNN